MSLLRTLYVVKMDNVDGKRPGAAGKQDQTATGGGGGPPASGGSTSGQNDTEMKGEDGAEGTSPGRASLS